jgi:LuxR family maltose regulon positive regulatory protein
LLEQRALCMQAEALKMAGRLRDASGMAEQALALAAEPGRAEAPAAGRAWVVLGNVQRAQNRVDAALESAKHAIALGDQGGSRVILVSANLLLAHVREDQGDLAETLVILDEVERLGGDYVRSGIEMFRIRIALSQGDPNPARRWAQAYEATRGKPQSEPNPFEREQNDMLLAHLFRAEGRPREAIKLLEGLRTGCRESGRMETLFFIDLETALAHQASGDDTLAIEALARALAFAEAEGYISAFLSEGERMMALLTSAIGRGISSAYASQLLGLIRAGDDDAGSSALPSQAGSQALEEPLSDRELDVLRLVAAGLSNKEIAETLVIAVGTVKRHLTNINGKLAVSSRTQAVARGRELGLLA